MITILGTGLLGTGFARAARRRGEHVQVWNRTPAKARALEADGAVACDDPAAAIRGAARVHVVLSDDAAVDEVLAAARPERGATVVDHSTTSTAGALRRTDQWRRSGVSYLHAPVFMGPGNALEASGLMLVSGDRELVAALTPALAPMTGKVVDLGARVDAAAAFKLLGNLLLMTITAGFADMLGLAKAMEVAPGEVAALLHHFNPGTSLPARFARMIEGRYDDPSWELAMARKDARLMQREAADAGIALAVLPAIAARMDAVIAEGFGAQDWTVLAREFLV
jgi:3-hydroxyisobutyrate dehydrogenase